MYSDRNGFLLTDALISIFIVSLMSALVYALCMSHLHVKEALQQERIEMEQQVENTYRMQEKCAVCQTEETDP